MRAEKTPPKHVPSQRALAALLSVNRETVARWQREPDAPKQTAKGYCVADWLTFAAEITQRSKCAKSDTKRALEIEKLQEVIRGLKMQNDLEAGLLDRHDDVVATITVLVSELRGHYRKIADALPMALQGQDIPTARITIRRFFDDLERTIHVSRLPILAPTQEQSP